jgi:hypothetical protein
MEILSYTPILKWYMGDNISGCEVAEELDILVNKMKNRRDENLCTSKHVSLLSDFEDHLSQ